jgi:pimeloyl-ACP methyl ester carboxylesterase
MALIILLLAGGGVAYLALGRSEPPDTRFNGAYLLDDGRLVLVTPRDGEVLRYRLLSGASGALWPVGEAAYEAGPGWAERQPVELQVEFRSSSDGVLMSWRPTDRPEQQARRLELPEVPASFASGELVLQGKLVLPEGEPPFPAVVLVHGSGKESAVDTYFMPYLFASHGIATLVYDKRGTGGSSGKYNQNFYLLSDDTVAAVKWLHDRSEIDPRRIHLAGYSQGGWIAPLAASKVGGIRSLLINYGPVVPVTGEDRWGYVYALREKGFGDDAIAKADRINELLGAIYDLGEDRWEELEMLLDEAAGEEWFAAIAGSDSMLGFIAGTKLPLWCVKLYAWWMTRGDVPYIDRRYDPVPTIATLDVPSLWIFGGEDSSMPSEESHARLEELRQKGRPIEVEVFANAEHGILLFREEESGERQYLGYAPGYLDLQVEWLRQQSDLP